jgi:hypothetical protein
VPDEHKATSVETTSVSWSYGTSQTIGHGITEVSSGPGCSLAVPSLPNVISACDQLLQPSLKAPGIMRSRLLNGSLQKCWPGARPSSGSSLAGQE